MKTASLPIVLAILTANALPAAEPASPTPAPVESRIIDWTKLTPLENENGARRNLFEGPTATLERFEGHVTTLKPGAAPHPPHRHVNEEMIIVKEGTLEATINGESKIVGPGSVLFFASNDLHGVRNTGSTDATYFVLNWTPRDLEPTP